MEKALDHARALIENEKGLSSSLRAALEVLLLLVQLLLGRTTLNSKKSSKPPSADPNRLKSTRQKSTKLSGAQVGHIGKTLEMSQSLRIGEAPACKNVVFIKLANSGQQVLASTFG